MHDIARGNSPHPDFDKHGNQLFVKTDARLAAANGESPVTHQNPIAALGQLGRNALFLYLNQHAA